MPRYSPQRYPRSSMRSTVGSCPTFWVSPPKHYRNTPLTQSPWSKGHLDQARKNQRSTKTAPLVRVPTDPDPAALIDDAFPASNLDNARTHQCFAAVFEPASGQIHSDQTGKFIVASSSGNNYVLVVYNYDSNCILVEPILSSRYSAILPVSGLIAWPWKAKCGREAAVLGKGDCGARASSRSRARAHAATCCKCLERVSCVCEATIRGTAAVVSLLGCTVLEG